MLLKTKKTKRVSSSSITTIEKGEDFSPATPSTTTIYSSKEREAKDVETLELPSTSRYSVHFDENTMSGLFFILRGQYCKKGTPVIVEGEERYFECYDPKDTTNPEWYIVMDRVVFNSIYSGSSREKALNSIGRAIERYRDSPKKYFREVSNLTSEDFYDVHYNKQRPLGAKEISKRAVGKQPRTSSAMWIHYMSAYTLYGAFLYEERVKIEEQAQERVKDLKHPLRKNLKRMKRHSKNVEKTEVDTTFPIVVERERKELKPVYESSRKTEEKRKTSIRKSVLKKRKRQ